MIRGRWKARMIGVCLLAAATLSGCQGTHDWRGESDPIRGGPPLPTGQSATSRPPASAEVPPLMTGRPSTSPAALAVNPGATDTDRRTPAVTIEAPRPLGQAPGVIVPMSGTVPATSSMVSAGGYTFEQLQREFEKRGVTEQHLDTTSKPGEWSFHCAVPTPNDPYTRRNYDTKMVGDRGLAAMRAVLEQIDRER